MSTTQAPTPLYEKLKKRFSPTGAVVHYEANFFIDPNNWNQTHLLPLVEQGAFFVLTAPSQTGKTSKALALMDKLKEQGMDAIIVDIAAAVSEALTGYGSISDRVIDEICSVAGCKVDTRGMVLSSFLIKGVAEEKKPLVLIFDEIHTISELPEQDRTFFLTQLRKVKQHKGSKWLKSILAISWCSGPYLYDSIGSAFNVLHQVEAPYWTQEEVFELIGQYETQEMLQIPNELKRNIYSVSAGAHGATVMLCKFLSNWIAEHDRAPTLVEWLFDTSLFQAKFSCYLTEFVNIQIMLRELAKPEHWTSLITWLLDSSYQIDLIVVKKLIQANVLRYKNQKLEIASPLVQRLLLNQLHKRRNEVAAVPTTLTGELDPLELVVAVVRQMCTFLLHNSSRRKSNSTAYSVPTALNEASFKNDFFMTLSNVFSHLYPTLKPEVIAEGGKKLDHLISLYHNDKFETLAIEHAANVSDKVLNSHVHDQAAVYHKELQPTLGTLVIHWTSVSESEHEYQFPQAEGVTVIHVWHDKLFLNWRVVFKDQTVECEAGTLGGALADLSLSQLAAPKNATFVEEAATFIKDAATTGTPIATKHQYSVVFAPEFTEMLQELKLEFGLPARCSIQILTPEGVPVQRMRNLRDGATYFVRVVGPEENVQQ